MFRSIVISIIRNFSKNIAFSFISLSGLVVGLTTTILIFLYVSDEVGYDRYHPDNTRVYCVLSNNLLGGEIETYDEVPGQVADFLATSVPEVEGVTRIDWTKDYLTNGEKSAHRLGIYADADFFAVFNPVIIAGNRLNLLPDNNSIVISQELAHMLFGDDEAVGKVISVNLKAEYKVTGVFVNFPANSSFKKSTFILPFSAKRVGADDYQITYIKLNKEALREAVEEKIDGKFHALNGNASTTSYLFCMTDARLHGNFENGKPSGGRIVYVITFSITALFILIMACVNYINIATARAAKRSREIGVRKMTGATRPVLICQFMIESLAVTFMATGISLFVVYWMLPLFNELVGLQLLLSLIDPVLLTGLLVISLFTGVIAGSYPALLLSSLKPAIVLKGNLYSGLTGAGLRKSLVVFQFTLSVLLISCAVLIWQQTDFMLKKDLGFDKHNIIHVYIGDDSKHMLNSFKSKVLQHPAIVSVGIGACSPIEVNGSGEVLWKGKPDDSHVILYGGACMDDYFSTLGLKVVQGRNFSPGIPSDSNNFIITQKAADLLGFDNPIGQSVTFDMYHNREGKIIGVIQDFHNDDIHAPMNPVIFSYSTEKNQNEMFIRYQEGRTQDALEYVRTSFNKLNPGIPMEYSFLDADFENQFYMEMLIRKLSVYFTVIAIIIACLGLFGLTLFNGQRRTKEIGVRKVLGASVTQVMVMLCRDFARPIMISFFLAFPLSWYLMTRFLETYVSHISISAFTFLLIAITMTGVVILTVSYQSFQAAVKNPVDTLKSE